MYEGKRITNHSGLVVVGASSKMGEQRLGLFQEKQSPGKSLKERDRRCACDQ
jgi:hypothetical protein